MIGESLGPYKILDKLGAGGMGEVYLAEDTRLDRRVAVKVLPAAVADNPEGLARLEQEAKILAQLEHPNVAAVYGLERASRDDGATTLMHLVMQYAEGETLSDRIGGGALVVDDALEIARQIAAGLGAAHDKGIVHRDLKPANVMLADGAAGAVQVKVLDFGLAKSQGGRDSGSIDMSASPTMAALTADGSILGTAAYMSPEQARGKATDRRTDVWAFGCVVFEMLTGDSAFPGETVSDVMAAILKEEPDWSALPADVLATVRRGLRRCLAKDPEQRPFDVRDVVLGFDAAEVVSDRTGESSSGLSRAAAAVLAAATLLGGAAGGYWLAGSEPSTGPSPTQPSRFRQMTTAVGAEWSPSLSGDAEWIVYASPEDGDWDIYLMSVGGANPINLTADEPAHDTMPTFSADGRSIAFRSERGGGGIFVMGRTGEAVRRVSDRGYNPSWSPDGTQVVVATESIDDSPYDRVGESVLVVIDVATGATEVLPTGDAVQPSWSPDGSRIVYWGLPIGSGQRDLWTVEVAGGPPVRLTEDPATDWTPTWSHDSAAVIFASDRAGTIGLWRIDIDPATGVAAGDPVSVVAAGGGDWLAYPSVSADGRSLLYAASRTDVDVWRLDLSDDLRDLVGDPVQLTRGSRNTTGGHLSPDGSLLAYQSGYGQQEDIFIQPMDGSPLVRLTNDPAKDRGARFSPDGQEVLFYSDRDGHYANYTVRIDGSGLKKLSGEGPEWAGNLAAWAPDGRQIAAAVGDDSRLVLLPSGEASPADAITLDVTFPDNHTFAVQSWSADGRYVQGDLTDEAAGISSGIFTIDVQTSELRQVTDFGVYSSWFPDSRHIAFRSGSGLFVVDAETRESWQVFDAMPNLLVDFLSAAPTGAAILVGMATREGDLWLADF